MNGDTIDYHLVQIHAERNKIQLLICINNRYKAI